MRRRLRDPVLLATGSVVSGLLAYLLFALVTRGLGAAAASPVSVLWTLWAVAGAAFTFPLQHWITRSLAAGREGDVRSSAGRVASLVAAVAIAVGVLVWILRERLFGRDDAWFPVLVVLVVAGSAAVGVLRGGLGGRGRMAAVAWSLVAENAVRCLLVGVLLVAQVHDPVAHGLCLVAGSLVAVWPSAWRFGRAGSDRTGSDRAGAPSGSLAFLGGAATGQLLAQGVLTGGAVLLALLGGSPAEVTALFATLALFRAPYMVVLGTLPHVTHTVTGLVVSGEVATLRSLARRLAVLGAVAVALAAVLGWVLGPALVRAVFGDTVDVGAGQAAVVATGCALALVNVVLMVGALAHDRPTRVAVAWGLAVLAGAAALVALAGTPAVDRVTVVFLLVEGAATLALAVVASAVLRSGRPAPRRADA
jgi:O-antigen/teichoic acid export membrane protein